MTPVIGVELRGGPGNQMFQYAFAIAASNRLNTDSVVYASNRAAMPGGEQLSGNFTLGGASSLVFEDPGYPTRWIDNQDYDRPEDVLDSLTDQTSYSGYFQSCRFFAKVEDKVRDSFRIRTELDEAFRERFADLLSAPYVCCPVRRGADYRAFIGGSHLPLEYYRDGLAIVSPPPGTPIVFVGDELDEVREELGSIEGARFEPNEPIVDFQLILHARAAVIPNSTFAWWGAWLADRCELVVAPQYWLGWRHRAGWHQRRAAGESHRRTERSWEYPYGIIPSHWSQVSIRRPWRERLAPWSIRSSLALMANNARATR
jgi:hypothetical protein